MGSLLGILGLFTLLSIALLLSENRSAINIKTVLYGLIFQLIFALFILKTPFGAPIFSFLDLILSDFEKNNLKNKILDLRYQNGFSVTQI